MVPWYLHHLILTTLIIDTLIIVSHHPNFISVTVDLSELVSAIIFMGK